MEPNYAAMVEQGYGRDLERLLADGFTCLWDTDDGELPACLFGKAQDGMVHLIQGADLLVFSADDFERIASAVMGMVMAARDKEVPA